MTRRSSPRFDRVAASVQRLAVLLAAGVAPARRGATLPRAGRRLGRSVSPWLEAVADLDAGSDLAAAITPRPRRSRPSAPPGARLRRRGASRARSALRSRRRLTRLAEVLRGLAQDGGGRWSSRSPGPTRPHGSCWRCRRSACWSGRALGVEPVRRARRRRPSASCASSIGVALLVVGRAVERTDGAGRTRRRSDPGLGLELLAIGLSGRRLTGARPRARRFGARPIRTPELGPTARAMLDFATSAGVPAVEHCSAPKPTRSGGIAHADARRRAELLGTRLLLPLGLCVLPAFVLLGVVPVVIAIVSTTVATW